MIKWLELTDSQRKATIDQAEQISGIGAKALEKDWWVTLVLKALFQSAFAKYMIFKGGTSLSKGWKLIARFSEDIDIALDPEVFGMQYIETPSKGYVERLKRRGCAFTSNELKAEIEKELTALGVPAGMVRINAADIPEERPDTDPQVLYIKYPSLYEPSDYLVDEVKVEVGVRSLRMPYTQVLLQSLLYEINPNPAYAETPFLVEVVEPRKTFLEKAMLLHEQFGKPNIENIKTERMSRHLYDLGNLMNTSFGRDALSDHELYDHLVHHRQWYSRISWVDYQTLGHSAISFLPPPAVLEMYREDYQAMKDKMIYEEVISFDDLINQLKILQGRFRIKKHPISLEEIIQAAEIQILQTGGAPEAQPIRIPITYLPKPNQPAGADNNPTTYLVTLFPSKGKLVFESIRIQ